MAMTHMLVASSSDDTDLVQNQEHWGVAVSCSVQTNQKVKVITPHVRYSFIWKSYKIYCSLLWGPQQVCILGGNY